MGGGHFVLFGLEDSRGKEKYYLRREEVNIRVAWGGKDEMLYSESNESRIVKCTSTFGTSGGKVCLGSGTSGKSM